MFGLLRERLDPDNNTPFAIPEDLRELRRQLAPIPLMYDGEGRLLLPPKNKADKNSNVQTLYDIIGNSPDEADSLVLAYFAMVRKSTVTKARAL